MTLLKRLLELFGASPRSSRIELVPDYMWLSSAVKFKVIQDRLSSRSEDRMMVLVAHFPNVLEELQRLADEFDAPDSIGVVLARQLSPASTHDFPREGSGAVDLLVAERHPLASADAALLEFAETLEGPCRLEHHVSLDDPLLLYFGADSIRKLIARMGAEDDIISHPLVSRSIHKAQLKLEKESFGRADADSAAEWIARNTRSSVHRRSADTRPKRR